MVLTFFGDEFLGKRCFFISEQEYWFGTIATEINKMSKNESEIAIMTQILCIIDMNKVLYAENKLLIS